MKTRTKEHALKLALAVWREMDTEGTDRQIAENMIIRLKCIRFAIPNAKQRIMQSTPVLGLAVSYDQSTRIPPHPIACRNKTPLS
jgi:hypothetical protein